jgi:hypothetical protein
MIIQANCNSAESYVAMDSDNTIQSHPTTDSDTSSVDNSAKRTTGKWSPEEELYAEFLIQCFRNGSLNDCQAMTTLRVYLAEKLNCKPMRVAKKYATQDYGGNILYVNKGSDDKTQYKLDTLRQRCIDSVRNKKKGNYRKRKLVFKHISDGESSPMKTDRGFSDDSSFYSDDMEFRDSKVYKKDFAHDANLCAGKSPSNYNDLEEGLTDEDFQWLEVFSDTSKI